ncbi:DUF2235 domain-containing protein [Rhodobacteraceae bacterium]|nr:DUF2235 domain-containing protein [Paracoccaceae bacterium]
MQYNIMTLMSRIRGLAGFFRRTERVHQSATPEPVDHIVLLDGTMSSLEEGSETNVGLIYKLLCSSEDAERLSIFYEAGNQWSDWSKTLDIIEGRGINRQIRRVYEWLSSRYRPGDRIFLIGFSRGAYAIRSLGGVIDEVGLLRKEHTSEHNVHEAYRRYREGANDCPVFSKEHCHVDVPIEMIGVFDTVKSLGFRAPFVWKWADIKHSFHNHRLGKHVRRGYHALALDETREAFRPVLWKCPKGHEGQVEQMWFRGSHGDVGGQLSGFKEARLLSNIPLHWMLEKAELSGLDLPEDWRERFPTDEDARSAGTWRGWSKYFLARKKRVVGEDLSETIHPTAIGRSRRAKKLVVPLPSS